MSLWGYLLFKPPQGGCLIRGEGTLGQQEGCEQTQNAFCVLEVRVKVGAMGTNRSLSKHDVRAAAPHLHSGVTVVAPLEMGGSLPANETKGV